MDIVKTIAKHGYMASPAQVEQLASVLANSTSQVADADSCYLKVVVAAMQATMGVGKPGPRKAYTPETQLAVLNSTVLPFYQAVLRGVTTPDIEDKKGLDKDEAKRRALERNRRSIFARTTKSTLVAFIKTGGDVRAVDVQTVTKGWLRPGQQPSKPRKVSAIARVASATNSLMAALETLCKKDADKAVSTIGGLHVKLDNILQTMVGKASTAVIVPNAVVNRRGAFKQAVQ